MRDWQKLLEKYPHGLPETLADEALGDLWQNLALSTERRAQFAEEVGATLAEVEGAIEWWMRKHRH
jgi:hypothetical protein